MACTPSSTSAAGICGRCRCSNERVVFSVGGDRCRGCPPLPVLRRHGRRYGRRSSRVSPISARRRRCCRCWCRRHPRRANGAIASVYSPAVHRPGLPSCASSKTSASTWRHLYGLTETFGPAVVSIEQPEWASSSDEERAKLVARQGVANVVAEPVRVIDDAGTDVAPDGRSHGEISIRGNNVMLGYYRDDVASDRCVYRRRVVSHRRRRRHAPRRLCRAQGIGSRTSSFRAARTSPSVEVERALTEQPRRRGGCGGRAARREMGRGSDRIRHRPQWQCGQYRGADRLSRARASPGSRSRGRSCSASYPRRPPGRFRRMFSAGGPANPAFILRAEC